MPVTMPGRRRVVVVQVPGGERRELEERRARDRAAGRCARATGSLPCARCRSRYFAPPPCFASARARSRSSRDEAVHAGGDWLPEQLATGGSIACR